MGKNRALKIEIEIVLPNDRKTEDILKQLQDFILDEIPIDDSDMEWEPFDCGAITITLLEDHPNAYIEIDDGSDEPKLPARKLDSAIA
jgi:hypothetical protein